MQSRWQRGNSVLDYVRDGTPVQTWMNGICSYSLWWIIIHQHLYQWYGDLDYLKEQKDYLSAFIRIYGSNPVPRSLRLMTGDSYLLADEPVHQSRFADIRSAYQSYETRSHSTHHSGLSVMSGSAPGTTGG